MTTSTKHTPGPWQISSHAAGKNGTSLTIWRNDEGPDAPDDADNTNWACIAKHVHREADARLIAASPDLLALARAVVADVECYCADYVAAPSPCTHCVAKGLVAKAEGR